jgi:hypothetical protein
MTEQATAPRYMTLHGQRVLVVTDQRGLPQKLDGLLEAMAHFGFAFRDDFTPTGTRTACEAANDHRLRVFREGRWWNPAPFRVHGDHPLAYRVVDAGQLLLRLEMCQDCAAVCVRDVSPELALGARATRLVNRVTGAERIAPAVGRRNVVLGWYSGKRRAGREYR